MFLSFLLLCCHSVTKLYPTFCNPIDCSVPGFPALHYIPEFAQIHAHWVSDAIQPSYPLLLPSPHAFNLIQHQGFFPMSQLFTSGGQSIGASTSASVLPMNIQGSFPLGPNGLISLSPRNAHESSLAPQFKSIHSSQPSLWSSSHIRTWLLEKPHLWLFKPLSAKWCLCFLVYYLGLS